MSRLPGWPGPVGARSARSKSPPTAARVGRKRSFRRRCIRRRIPGLLLTGLGTEKRRCSCRVPRMRRVTFSRRARSCIKTGASLTRIRKRPSAPFISMPSNPGGWPAMGVCTMRCSPSLLAFVMILAAPAAGLAQSPRHNVGTPLSQEEIKSFDFLIGPQGQELPAGHGTAKEGAVIFAKRCEVCHGKNGESGVLRRLVLGKPGQPFRGPFKAEDRDSIAYYPYATIAWDYINRAMPVPKPGSLTHDEVYAATAFLLYRNGIIGENDVMDEKTLPKVQMPNRNGFIPAVPVYPPEKKPSWW